VAVIGAGLGGAGWAIVFARAGGPVRMFDRAPQVLERAPDLIAQQLAQLESHGLLPESAAAICARITVAHSLRDALDGAAYAQESVLEKVDIKRQLMEEIDALGFKDLIVGSSTSGFPASDFALDLGISPRVLVAHPVNPPYLVPIVELVGSPQTSAQTVDWTHQLMEAVGQSVVRVNKEIEGFVLNRLQAALLREAWTLVADGVASCEDIDKTIRDGLGWRWSFIGPFETIDLNAPDGVADYARRFGPLYHRIAQSRDQKRPWDEPLIAEVEGQRREKLQASQLNERRAWRDDQLMKFAVHRAKSRDS
jgi:3-hydroxyacyl-CoA dehydrogenase